jgi:DNA-binding NarL/FixJ family response regulator
LPGENGLSLTRRLNTEYPATKVIILTDNALPEYREAAHRCGADCFFPKGTPVDEIFAAVESCFAGTGLLGPSPDRS